MIYLRQSTASQEVLLGPFLDDTDGKTAETALTVANTDVKVWKHGGTTEASKNSGGATHIAAGRYYCVLDATDTDTIGGLELNVHVAGALPVKLRATVLDEAVYDVLFGTTALSTLGGTAQTGDNFARLGAPAGASVSADLAAVKAQTAAIEVDTADIQGRLPAALVSGRIDASVGAMAAGTVTAAAIATDAIDADALADGAITAATFAAGAIDATAIAADAIGASELAASAVAEIADQVWEEALADHSGTVGSTAEQLAAAGAAGDPWATAIPGAYGAGTAGKVVGDNLNATVSSRATQTSVDDVPTNAELATALGTADDAVLAAIAALNNLSAAGVRTAVGLASANLDTQLGDLPTAIENADALLKRDWTGLTGEAARSVLNALRKLRNKWSIAGPTLTVTKEDDTTAAYAQTITSDAAAEPITAIDN